MFKVTKKMSARKQYPDLAGLFVNLPDEEIEVTIEAELIAAIYSGKALVQYTVSTEGMTGNGSGVIEVPYDGASDPLILAENLLQKTFEVMG